MGIKTMAIRATSLILLAASTAALSACEEVNLAVPTAEEVQANYAVEGALEAEINGNVAQITVEQSATQLRRGGSLWAKVGPFIYLFSAETRGLFETYDGLAGVRVITTSGGREVARAMLRRDALNDVTWRRAINIAGVARRDGTKRPSKIEELIEWGEEHTDHAYDSRFVRE